MLIKNRLLGQPVFLCLIVVHLLDVNFALFGFAKQVLAEEVGHLPEEVFVHGLKSVTLSGENEHLEAFVGTDKSIYHAGGICRVYIVVHVAGNEQKVSFEAFCKFLIGADAV